MSYIRTSMLLRPKKDSVFHPLIHDEYDRQFQRQVFRGVSSFSDKLYVNALDIHHIRTCECWRDFETIVGCNLGDDDCFKHSMDHMMVFHGGECNNTDHNEAGEEECDYRDRLPLYIITTKDIYSDSWIEYVVHPDSNDKIKMLLDEPPVEKKRKLK